MSLLLDATRIKSEGSRPVVGFEQPAYDDGSVGWDRYLTLERERAYFIGGVCDTCEFLFERMRGANRNISPGEQTDALRRGLRRIGPALAAAVGGLIPGGNYRVSCRSLRRPW